MADWADYSASAPAKSRDNIVSIGAALAAAGARP